MKILLKELGMEAVEYNVFIVYNLSLLIYVTCMVVMTPSLVYIYISQL